jgi:hypothetical protein
MTERLRKISWRQHTGSPIYDTIPAMSTFSHLLDFIQNRMRMSHIYQPVMLSTLIKGGGTASVVEIASQFAQRDQALKK